MWHYLCNECHQLPEVLGLLLGVEVEDLADAVIMVPLLQELLFVRCRIAFYEVL